MMACEVWMSEDIGEEDRMIPVTSPMLDA